MNKTPLKLAGAAIAICVPLFGCDSNPTNEPPPAAIDQANAKRAAAIDNDPKMTPDEKAKMKSMLHLDGGAPGKPK